MNKYIKQFALAGLIFHVAGLACAEETPLENTAATSAVLEKASVTIRMTNNKPYGELRLCESCPLRLLPFAPNALIYLHGQRQTSQVLTDGQSLMGTVFLESRPVDLISEIVAH